MDDDDTPRGADSAETTTPAHPDPGEALQQEDTPVLSTPADILAWVPYHLGFWPHDSVVLMALHDQQRAPSAAGLVMRIDLAALGDPASVAEAGAQLESHLQRDGATRALCLVYRDCASPGLMRQDTQVVTLLDWWLGTPWGAPERTFLVAEDAFCCLECRTEPCCPPSGRPLEVLHDTAVAAHQVFQGRSYVTSRDALVPEPEIAEKRREQVTEAAAEHFDSRPADGSTRLSLWRTSVLLLWEDLLAAFEAGLPGAVSAAGESKRSEPGAGEEEGVEQAGGELDVVLAAELIAGLSDPIVRDAIVIDAGCPEGATIASLDDAAEQMFTGRVRPDLARVNAAERLLQQLTGQASELWDAPVLVVRAWLAWWCADGAKANILLDRALQCDPEHTMAQLLRTMLDHGAAPGWVGHHGGDAVA